MPRTRTFIGIDIGEPLRLNVALLQQQLAQTGVTVKWVAPPSLHVTLLFLGEVDDRDLPAVCEVVQTVAAQEAPFPLGIAGLGAFPNPRRPKVLWSGITAGQESLQRLHAALEPPLLALGCYRQEDRAYTPHLTLGRIKSDSAAFRLTQELTRWRTWPGGSTQVDEILVFSSELERSGPVYQVLSRAPLRGQAQERTNSRHSTRPPRE
ncbi:MAG: RNA 2',3'-cyclic phosphodiesterase [Gemmataceae bacterium]|nr:RNA 2',3'-cyclic phosphodiesterase [Gemmata sp.]MDW8196017.1 RNA 2',3'-cyclic phosphodiesterase [Gemmataceae bacterium]